MNDLFNAVKTEADIREVYSTLTGNNPSNFNSNVSCPLPDHRDKTPSCSIDPAGNCFFCHTCGIGGSVIDMVKEVQGMTALEAAKWLAEEFNINYEGLTEKDKQRIKKRQRKQDLLKKFVEKAHDRLKPRHREALNNRGISDRTINKYQFGYYPQFDKGQLQKFEDKQSEKYKAFQLIGAISSNDNFIPSGRIIIPFWRYNKPVYWVAWDKESEDRKYLYPAGLDRPVIQHRANSEKEIYIPEGVFDFYSLVEADKNAITSLNAHPGEKVINQSKKEGKKAYIALDGDSTGREAAKGLARELAGEIEAEVLNLPPDKDINDLLQECSGDIEEFNNKLECLKWSDPLPFNDYDVEELDPAVLPDWLQNFVESVAEFTQTPVSMGVMLVLSALGTALANKGIIEVRNGYTEPLNIWTCTVLPTGSRKSPVFSKVTEPIQEYEKRRIEDIAPEKERAESEKEVLEEKVKKLEKKAIKTDDEGKRRELFKKIGKLKDKIREKNIPNIPTLFADDVTTESIAQSMDKNFGRFAILSPEGDIFKIMGGLYSQKVNLSNFKKGWTGGETIKEGRMGREGVRIDSPALTMGLTVQPTTIRDLDSKKIFRGEGLLARFLYIMPDSLVGQRKSMFDVKELEEVAVSRYKKGLQALLNCDPKAEKDGEWEPHTIKLSSQAKNILRDFSIEIEKKLGEDGELYNIRDWGNKLVGNVIRIAGLIHLASQVDAKNGQAKDIWDKPLAGEAMLAAVNLGRRLIPHALKVFSLLDVDPEISLAKYVLKRIKKGKEMERSGKLEERFNKSELDKAVLYKLVRKKKEIKKPENLEKPIKLLKELNYIEVVEQSSEGRGRPPSPKLKLNPKVGALYTLNTLKKEKQDNKMDKVDKMPHSVEKNSEIEGLV